MKLRERVNKFLEAAAIVVRAVLDKHERQARQRVSTVRRPRVRLSTTRRATSRSTRRDSRTTATAVGGRRRRLLSRRQPAPVEAGLWAGAVCMHGRNAAMTPIID